MNPPCTPKTRSVWPTLPVKIARQKVGVGMYCQASRTSHSMGLLVYINMCSFEIDVSNVSNTFVSACAELDIFWGQVQNLPTDLRFLCPISIRMWSFVDQTILDYSWANFSAADAQTRAYFYFRFKIWSKIWVLHGWFPTGHKMLPNGRYFRPCLVNFLQCRTAAAPYTTRIHHPVVDKQKLTTQRHFTNYSI